MNQQDFLFDLQNSGLGYVYQIRNPDEAVELWTQTFISVYKKQAPFLKKTVKQVTKPPWITREIDEEIYYRGLFLKSGKGELFKTQRNEVTLMNRKLNANLDANIFKNWLFHANLEDRLVKQ